MLTADKILFDVKYAQYCKYVSSYSSQWEDLYQDFRLWVLESIDRLKKISQNEIEYFCKAVIYRMWTEYSGNPNSRKKKGEHLRLANYADRALEITDSLMVPEPEPEVTEAEIKESLRSLLKNPETKKKAELFKEFINGKNRLNISKETGINYRLVHDAVRQTAENIKSNMTKNEIKARLLSEGISANYSGKQKTFYTNKKPSVDLEKAIVRAGFKQQTK